MSITRERVCETCGFDKATNDSGKFLACSGCKSVYYCCMEHLRFDREVHKYACVVLRAKLAAKDKKTGNKVPISDTVIVVEVKSEMGNGISNVYKNHIFPNKKSALYYIGDKFTCCDWELKPLANMPFLTEVMKFRSAELYINPDVHEICDDKDFTVWGGMGSADLVANATSEETLNGLGINLGSKLKSGLSAFNNIRGTVFFIGKTAENMYVTSNILWGAANFIAEARGYYNIEENNDHLQHTVFKELGERYVQKKWQPKVGSDYDGQVYEIDVSLDRRHKLINHCGSGVKF